MSSDLASQLLTLTHALPVPAFAPTDALASILKQLRASPIDSQRRTCALQDSAGRSALHHAAIAGATWAVEPLLAAGANSHMQDGQGQTPLHLCLKAAADQRKTAASFSSSSSSSGSSSSHECFLQCARLILAKEAERLQSLLAALTPAIADAATPATAAAAIAADSSSDEHAPKRAKTSADESSIAVAAAAPILSSSAPSSSSSLMSLADSFDRLPLHWAVTCGDEAILLNCLTMMNDAATASAPAAAAAASPAPLASSLNLVNAVTRSGDSALHWSCADGRLGVVDLLLSSGADPSLRNARGETPADLCKSEHIKSVLKEWEQKRMTAAAVAAAAKATTTVSASSLSSARSGMVSSSSTGGAKKKVAIKLKK